MRIKDTVDDEASYIIWVQRSKSESSPGSVFTSSREQNIYTHVAPRTEPYLCIIQSTVAKRIVSRHSRDTPIVDFILSKRLGDVQHVGRDSHRRHRLRNSLIAVYCKLAEDIGFSIEPAEGRDRFVDVLRVGRVILETLRRGLE